MSFLPCRFLSTTRVLCSRIGMRPVAFDPTRVHLHFENPYARPAADTPKPKKKQIDERAPYTLTVRGPLGELQYPVKACVRLETGPNTRVRAEQAAWEADTQAARAATEERAAQKPAECVRVSVEFPTIKRQKTIWGTTRAVLANMIHGVTAGWTWKLKLVGVGYRAAVVDGTLQLALGYANLIQIPVPPELKVVCPTQDTIEVTGIDKHVVSQYAANIRKHRPPEPYNQKGIFVNDEVIQKKKSKK